ncbi:hypothetical protein OIU78_009323 [Salix suchowensis]|nr:hypothetical protein OIU78_009323 [Salix suchowensis]
MEVRQRGTFAGVAALWCEGERSTSCRCG